MNNPIDIGAMYGINSRSSQMLEHDSMNMGTSDITNEMNMSMQGWGKDSCNAEMTPYNDMTMHNNDMQYNNREQNMYSNQSYNVNSNQRRNTNQGRANAMADNSYMQNMHTSNNAQLMPLHNNMGMQNMNTAPAITIKNSHLNDKNNIEHMNDLLRTQVGKLAEVEFLIGTNSTHLKQGQITGVGTNYIVIKEFDTGRTTIGNFENIKFVTIYDTNYDW
ncbi:MAG: hypothetical protein UD936_11465 [Acutalibacteraceae bacterium]|nr:hypothetical protein [Acutalibacteraceae bacterium]